MHRASIIIFLINCLGVSVDPLRIPNRRVSRLLTPAEVLVLVLAKVDVDIHVPFPVTLVHVPLVRLQRA